MNQIVLLKVYVYNFRSSNFINFYFTYSLSLPLLPRLVPLFRKFINLTILI